MGDLNMRVEASHDLMISLIDQYKAFKLEGKVHTIFKYRLMKPNKFYSR